MTGGDLDAVIDAVADRVTPTPEERERLDRVVTELVDRIDDAVAAFGVDADVRLVGSAARDTWLSGDRDVDVFVRFPPALPREDLVRYGLRIGHDVLPDGHEQYAEHPYVRGTLDGFDVDLVPCYRVEAATDLATAVDRTPFHSAYLEARLTPELADAIRVCKQFLKGIGTYGSDLRTRGFSGYLTELLVIEYGGFVPLVDAAADWAPPVHLDPADHGERSFDDPLVVIDPTDPERNVAAVLSAANLARLQHYARRLLAAPTLELFSPPDRDPLTPAEVRDHLERRGTTPMAVVIDTPDLVDDELYPQLRKSLDGLGDALDRAGFETLRRDVLVADRAALVFELEVAALPRVERHDGPPVHVREHAEGFLDAYADDPDVYGPFIRNDRYVVERDRDHTHAADFLRGDAVFDARLGPAVEAAFRDGYDVLVGGEVASIADTFGVEFDAYFDPRP